MGKKFLRCAGRGPISVCTRGRGMVNDLPHTYRYSTRLHRTCRLAPCCYLMLRLRTRGMLPTTA